MGSGKTIYAVNQVFKFLNKYPKGKVMCNLTIKNQRCKKIELEDLFELEDNRLEVEHLLFLDEAYTWMESRLSGQAENIYIAYFTAQSRKRNLDIIATAQIKTSLDLRFRFLEDLTTYALPRNPKSTEDFNYLIMNDFKKISKKILYKDAKKFLFDKFDTYELIMSSRFYELKEKILLSNPKNVNKRLSQILDKMKKKDFTIDKVTHDSVKDLLTRMEESLLVEPYLYVRLKTVHGD